jgi:hypothetical protein
MNTYSRILAALLLLGASGSVGACGDDDDDGGGGNGGTDAGRDADTEEDGDVGGEDADTPDAGGGDSDGGAGEDPPDELDECPKHTSVVEQGDYCVISGSTGSEIKTDLKLSPVKDKKGYIINKGVFVGEDVGGKAAKDTAKKSATLTITKGTNLYGGDTLAFLLINRGSKIVAEGTREYPIVFSASAAELRPGRWGGVIINGRAPSNRADANGDVTGEAGTGKYSGPDAADNSGSLKYVRIEFSGSKIDDRNELNGLALQGVGSGTNIDYIHVHGNDDDGVEFFGGTVNAKHLAITGAADDGIDWTDGWNGKVQFALVQQWSYTNPGTGAGDAANGIEADNNDQNAKATPVSEPTLSNFTLIGDPGITAPAGGNGLLLRRGTKGQLSNFVVLSYKTSCISLRGADSAGFAGTSLTLDHSRVLCDTQYEPAPGRSMDADPTAAAKLFDTAGNNEKPASADDLLEKPFAQDDSAKFTPKEGSDLLEGGEAPSDGFFQKVDFIGAMGAEDWTAGGNWFKVTTF